PIYVDLVVHGHHARRRDVVVRGQGLDRTARDVHEGRGLGEDHALVGPRVPEPALEHHGLGAPRRGEAPAAGVGDVVQHHLADVVPGGGVSGTGIAEPHHQVGASGTSARGHGAAPRLPGAGAVLRAGARGGVRPRPGAGRTPPGPARGRRAVRDAPVRVWGQRSGAGGLPPPPPPLPRVTPPRVTPPRRAPRRTRPRRPPPRPPRAPPRCAAPRRRRRGSRRR